ncbi:homeobox and leucine zipper protein Homez [Hemicordylus capensis]|uniref:homeobox and leucine zipper protein Homez n=1 Tax=Hemicordylus capensis TaxID=884348 RepID=UPI0023031851|nr:homeobox and leucine zipper protein Homez [Hemicordylus capensis]XP_053122571.1 homeobox and leucine zipper protein Homez [Hemicordylus capensis]XP_053122572.1 homeobox and leucine zipper protein Homez [Hemicordylus capensis]XP_053122573.1 homeobox and leucine zipper protein Homez [Hemicordylus capensis]XP_053122574.1 homeobox and leucine zipper protein Homez [Hemicordylus capensis]XP_053122576.1 homeobox and leucine zipper protein Homez [Hemicordylus capensis]
MPPNKDAPGCLSSPPGLICLPPISEDLQLVWTQAAQTSDLDSNQHLLQTFSYFPYPSLSDLALLCLRHSLHMEKVKAWFMAQRLRCGISWSAEEIEETRARLIYHQDQLHFSCLLAGNDSNSWHQSCKGQECHQPAPASVQHSSKYQENQQYPVTASSHCSTVQGTRELGRITQDIWELKGNALSHHSKAPENHELAGASLHFHHYTKETLSSAYLPTTTTSLDYKLQNSHTMAWDPTKSSQQSTETITSAVNGGHHPAILPTCPSNKVTPSSSTAIASVSESSSLQKYRYSVGDQQQVSGYISDILRKPRRKTKEQLDVLKSFFLHRQWARREDYHQLEQTTGLPRAEIIQWFGDTRYALKHGQLKWFRDNGGQNQEPISSLPPHSLHTSHPNTSPLERYWAAHLQLQESDLPALCLESGMDAEQVLKWFRSHSPAPCEVEVCLGDEDEVDEEVAAAMIRDEDEDYEEEEDDGDDDDDDEEDWVA